MYQAPPAQVPDGHPWHVVQPHVVLSHPELLHGWPHVDTRGEDLAARPPTPTADVARAMRPMKLRRVMRLPTRRVAVSNSLSNDMIVDLHRLAEWVFSRCDLYRRVGNQAIGLG